MHKNIVINKPKLLDTDQANEKFAFILQATEGFLQPSIRVKIGSEGFLYGRLTTSDDFHRADVIIGK